MVVLGKSIFRHAIWAAKPGKSGRILAGEADARDCALRKAPETVPGERNQAGKREISPGSDRPIAISEGNEQAYGHHDESKPAGKEYG